MGYLLEIVGSTIVGGMILLLIMRMNITMLQSSTSLVVDRTVQSNTTYLVGEIENDLKKAGYKVSSSPVFLTADSNRVSFLGDVDNNNTVDTITYYLSSTDALLNTINPNDMYLYRIQNGSPAMTSNLGVVDFHLWYFDQNGSLTATLENIKYVKYVLEVESTFPVNDENDTLVYRGAYAEKIVRPNNLR